MAIVDLKSGKIIGCKEGSLTWYHEKAHLLYNNSEKGIKNSFRQSSFFMLSVIFLVVTLWSPNLYFKVVTSVALVLFIYYYIYEEVWCWSYAWRVKKGVVYKLG